jgi:hypothetical protein
MTSGRPPLRWSKAAIYVIDRAVLNARPPSHVARLLCVVRRSGVLYVNTRASFRNAGAGRVSPSAETVRRRMNEWRVGLTVVDPLDVESGS